MKKIVFALIILSMVFAMSLSFVSADSGVSTITVNLLNQDPDPVVAGDIVELRLTVENLGSVAVSNLVVEIDESFPLSLVDSTDALRSFGSVNSFQEGDDAKIIKYEFQVDSQAVAGIYNLEITYSDSADSSTVIKNSIPVEVKNLESAEISVISKSVFYPGEQDEIVFTIKNVGSAPLNDLFFSFSAEDGVLLPVESGSAKYIKQLDVGAQIDIDYVVVADSAATVGLYELGLSLDFKNSLTGSSEQMTTISGVYIGGETDFILALSQSESNEYSFTIANIGMTQAGAVTVNIPQQDTWDVTGADTSMIGNLNTGDYTLVSFTLSSSKNAAPLEIIISYTDTMGVRHDVVKNLSLTSTSLLSSEDGEMPMAGSRQGPGSQNESTNNTTLWIVIIIVVIAVSFIVRKKYLSKRKTSHNATLSRASKKGTSERSEHNHTKRT